MKQLKRQIRESFFNPILYFLPALVFMLADDFWDENIAWRVSFPIAFGLLFYVYFRYRTLFLWHAILSVGYLIIALISTFVPDTPVMLKFIDEVVFFALIGVMFIKKESLEKIAFKTLPYKLPMSNNENELFRVAKVLLIIVFAYLTFNFIFQLSSLENNELSLRYLKIIYALAVFIVGVFETIRVFIVHDRLINEDWLPIVDEKGKVTGSRQFQPNIQNEVRTMHPAVRLYFIENGMIFLQKRNPDDPSEPFRWDASLSRHVRMTESIDMVLKAYTYKLYKQEQEKFLFLTTYIYNSKYSDHYIYLFVSCKTNELEPQKEFVFQTKWWTQKQIEDNLETGIFTERFEKEYEILKRSGLLEQGHCDCECALMDLIKNKLEKSPA